MQDAPPDLPSPTPAVEPETLSFAQTRALIRSDFVRLVQWYGGGSLMKRIYWFFQPNYLALFFYRLYRYLFVNDWHNLARVLFLFSLYLTGVEISPTTFIGDSCLIAHAFGVVLFGRLGSRVSIFGQGGTGGGVGVKLKDIGGGPGYPVVGDDVVFGIKAMAIGPIRIGNRAKLGPAAFVTHDVPEDAKIMAIPSRVIKVRMGAPTQAAGGDEATEV
jgi:serine acetyltransferase